MEKYLDKNSVLRLLQGIKTQIDKSKQNVLDTKGVANGIASLDAGGNVPLSQLGNLDTTFFEIVAELPTDIRNIKKHIYILKDSKDGENNKYAEYIYTGDLTDAGVVDVTKWEKLGDFVPTFDLQEYVKKKCAVVKLEFYDPSWDGAWNGDDDAPFKTAIRIGFADGSHKYLDVPEAMAPIGASRSNSESSDERDKPFQTPGRAGFMSASDKDKLDKIDLNALTASITAANTAADNTNKAIKAAETATAGVEKVDAKLEGNVLTVINRNGEQKSVNLTDTDEHVTVNCTTTMEGVSMEGLVINVYVNNGADPHQYTTNANGQAEFTITKGATYKVVFPYVQKCNIIDPVQHVASVGNRIIDANYVAETEKMERLTIKMSKADESGNVTPWEGGKAYVTIAGKKTEYIMDADGKAVVEIKNGTSYTVSVDKIDGMYEQYGRYSITRTAIFESFHFNFIYRPYESGIWLIDDNNKQWTYDDWEASGNDNSKLMFVRIATLDTQRYQGDILISIDKMADLSKVDVTKQWCNQNVEFKSIPLNGRNTNYSTWSRFAYNGLLATQTIIAEGDERGLTTPAADFCYSCTIRNADKTYQGYLPTTYQWELTWQNIDIVIDAINKKNQDLNVNKTVFSGIKWTSTQQDDVDSCRFTTAVGHGGKFYKQMTIPFYACLSDSPSLLSLSNKTNNREL
jgi:hypothetical protein|nr:MAG TPA: hypothetical protein [Caudoviricetes sp.]